MSSYMSFYAKQGDKPFTFLREFSRNTAIYKALECIVPYGEVVIVDLDYGITSLEDTKAGYEAAIAREEAHIQDLFNLKGFVLEEVTERLWECRSSIESLKEEIEEVNRAIIELQFLNSFNDEYSKVTVYAGIETGYNP